MASETSTDSHLLKRVEPLLLVAVGGFAGAILRHVLAGALPAAFPWGTLAANVLGSFFLGVLVAAPVDDGLLLVFGTGFCGAFTTFSTFAFETVRLFETGERRQAAVNAAVNLAGSLAAVGLGSVLVGLVT